MIAALIVMPMLLAHADQQSNNNLDNHRPVYQDHLQDKDCAKDHNWSKYSHLENK